MNKLDTSKEHIKTLESMSRFCMILAKANEADMQCDENRFNTDRNKPVNHLPNSCWGRYVIDSTGRNGVPSLCVFGKPYVRGLCDSVGRIASYIHFSIRSALT